MPRDARSYLWRALHAADLAKRFVDGRGFAEYPADDLVRFVVERQFEIIGEALTQLSRVDPGRAALIADLPRLVAFRNILIHGYAIVDDALVGCGRQQAAGPARGTDRTRRRLRPAAALLHGRHGGGRCSGRLGAHPAHQAAQLLADLLDGVLLALLLQPGEVG